MSDQHNDAIVHQAKESERMQQFAERKRAFVAGRPVVKTREEEVEEWNHKQPTTSQTAAELEILKTRRSQAKKDRSGKKRVHNIECNVYKDRNPLITTLAEEEEAGQAALHGNV